MNVDFIKNRHPAQPRAGEAETDTDEEIKDREVMYTYIYILYIVHSSIVRFKTTQVSVGGVPVVFRR